MTPACAHQSTQADVFRPAQTLEANAGDEAVFVRQRHHVGNRADGDEVGEAAADRFGISLQRAEQLEHHPHAGKLAERVGAVRPVRVDDGGGLREHRPAAMVVGDDHIHAERSGERGLLRGGDAGIDGDDEVDVGRKPFDGRAAEAVPLGKTVGNEIGAARAARGEIGIQHGRGGDAVYVIVAVDADALPRSDGLFDAGHGFIHIRQQERVVKAQVGFFDKRRNRRRLGQTARGQQPRGQRTQAERSDKLALGTFVVRPNQPFIREQTHPSLSAGRLIRRPGYAARSCRRHIRFRWNGE